jgi:hypothetical protein
MGAARIQGFSGKTAIYTDGTAPGDSGWQDCSGLAAPFTLMVEGILGGGKCQVYGTNREKPTKSYLGVQIGADITAANSFTTIAAPYRWVRVLISVVSTGAVSASFFGHRPPG